MQVLQNMTLPNLYKEKQKLQIQLSNSGYCCLSHYFHQYRFGDLERVGIGFDECSPKNQYIECCRILTHLAQVCARIDQKQKEESSLQARKKLRGQEVLEFHLRNPKDLEARLAASQMGVLPNDFAFSSSKGLIINHVSTLGSQENEPRSSALAKVCLAASIVAALVLVAATALFLFSVVTMPVSFVATALKISAGASVSFVALGFTLKLCC